MKGLEKWSTDHSLPLFFQQLEAWVLRQMWFTRELPLRLTDCGQTQQAE